MNTAHRFILLGFFASTLLLLQSCSTKKDTWSSRQFHTTTTRYNVYFNGREKHKEAIAKLETTHKDDYSAILPIFIYGDEAAAKGIYPEEDVCIQKCSKAIDRHSMEIKGKQLNKWIDDSYFLMGQAHFYKKDFAQAKDVFEFVAKQYKDEEIKYDALVWLTRTHIEKGKFTEAKKIIRLLENDGNLPPRLIPEFRLVYADYYLKQQNYEMAIPELTRAVNLTKKKKTRNRLMFILAQLHQQQNNAFDANRYYTQVIKNRPPYEMEFYAKINMAMAFNSDAGGSGNIRETLQKMLKDKKNVDYYDQIYFALGELSLKEFKRQEAMKLFLTSTETSKDNRKQKAKSFLKLADLHLEDKSYVDAQKFFDSTAAYVAIDHYRYDEIIRLKNSLGLLVKNINIIEREDSLQRLASLSKEELEKFIEKQIADAIKEEKRLEDEKVFEEQQRLNRQMNQGEEARRNQEMSGDNSWYFYNESSKQFGTQEFQKQWGKRPNEDHWRRSNKQSGGFDDMGLDLEALSGDIPKPPTLSERKSKEYYQKSIPDTPEKIEASNMRIKTAYFDLGSVYKEAMQDIPKAIETFETLVTRFDTSKHHPAAYYQLFLLYQKEGNTAKAEYYKNKLGENYEHTDYAKLAENPNYFDEIKENSVEVDEFYKKSLVNYKRGFYSQALASCTEAERLYPVNHLQSKFRFLKALSAGKTNLNKEMLIADLEALQKEFPGTPEAKEAKEIVQNLTNPPKIEAAKEEKPLADFKKFKYAPESNHSVILIVPDKAASEQLKNTIANFNREFFRTSPLSVTSVILDKERQMISIKLFKTQQLAMDYYTAFTLNKELLKEINEAVYPMFCISYENYPTFYKEKNVDDYNAFFQAVYIEKQIPENAPAAKEKPKPNAGTQQGAPQRKENPMNNEAPQTEERGAGGRR